MQLSSSLTASILLVTACASEPASTAPGSTSGDTGGTATTNSEGSSTEAGSGSEFETTDAGDDDASSSTGSPPPPPPPPLQPLELERAWVAGLEGAWLGPVRGTPLGDLPQFFWEFAWTDADALVGIADNGMGFRFEFAFAQENGQWSLTETGTLPGDMTQSYALHPVARQGDTVRFEVLDRPGFLQVDILPGEGTFEMAVFLRGEPHGSFDLVHPR